MNEETPTIRPIQTLSGYRSRHAGERVVVVGLGAQGQKVAMALRSMGYRLSAIYDPASVRIEEMQSRNYSGKIASSPSDLASYTKPDKTVAVICTLADTHLSLIDELSNAGFKKILCEKPVVNNMAELLSLEKMVDARGLNLKVNNGKNWTPDFKRIRELVLSKPLGRLREVKVRFRPGGFGNLGSHFLALIFYITGLDPMEVSSASFDTENVFSRSAKFTDFDGKADFVLKGNVPCSLNNEAQAIAGPALLDLVFEHGVLSVLESEFSAYYLRDDRTGTMTEFAFGQAKIAKNAKLATVYERLDGVMCDLIEDVRDPNMHCSFKAVEAIIGAQIAFVEKRKVSFPLSKSDQTPFPFS